MKKRKSTKNFTLSQLIKRLQMFEKEFGNEEVCLKVAGDCSIMPMKKKSKTTPWKEIKAKRKKKKPKGKKSNKTSFRPKASSSTSSNSGRQDTDWSDTQSRFRGPRGDSW